MNTRIPVDPFDPVGWVSRLPLLPHYGAKSTRRNPPSAQRGPSLGGLRDARQLRLNDRPLFCAANPPYESAEPRRTMSSRIPVGWVSRMPALEGITQHKARRNPPPAQRGATHGGLRAARQLRLNDRSLFRVANPPYESAGQRRSMSEHNSVGWVSRLPVLESITQHKARRDPPPAQRGATHGGLRDARQLRLNGRSVFSVANPPYESDSEPSRMLP
jgi:hypothetical protein